MIAGQRIMDPERIVLVQQSFEKVAALGDSLADSLYRDLFAIDPSLRAMFDGDLRPQHMKFMITLALIVRALHTPEKVLEFIRPLVGKHAGYGVRAEHYTPFGNALLRTLKKSLGLDYAPEVRDAWIEAYGLLAAVMRSSA